MPSPERGGHNPEQEPIPYYQAARFAGEQPAGQAYFQAHEAIYSTPESDLSVYRLQLNQIWHVAIIGDLPPEDLREKLQTILAAGEPAHLDPFVLKILKLRRDQANKQGSWVEGHYRPGKHL